MLHYSYMKPLLVLLFLVGCFGVFSPAAFVSAYTPDDFVFTIDTTISAGTADNQFQFCATAIGRDYTIDWGDGVVESYGTSPSFITHTYATSGVKTIVITPNIVGGFPLICQGADAPKILTIEQWGTNQWDSFASAFINASNLTITATDVPNLSNVTNLSQMFKGASSLNSDISNWDVSTINNMQGMFENATAFNQDLSAWDVSSVTNMSVMFAGATAFNQDLSAWDVSNVISFYRMFHQSGWNQSLAAWNISPSAQISYMIGSDQFNQPFTSWTWLYNPARTSWAGLLAGANAFTQDITNLVIPSNITDIREFFASNSSFNQNISAWNVSNITDMRRVFNNSSSFNQPLNSWNTTNVFAMGSMFDGATAFNQDLSAWDVSSVTDMSFMFIGATSFNQDLSAWDVSSVTDISYMFYGASSFDQSLGTWPIQNGAYIESILENSGMTTQNYSATLVGWANRNLAPGSGTTIGGVPSTYCDTAQAARDVLTTNGWIITDLGAEVCSSPEIESPESNGSGNGTKIGIRDERLSSLKAAVLTASTTPVFDSIKNFIGGLKELITHLTNHEEDINNMNPDERKNLIVLLRDALLLLLRFLPGM